MSLNTDLQPLDLSIRHFVYKQFVAQTRPPSVAETANAFALTEAAARAAYKRLHDQHFFFLTPGTTDIRMANPLSAIPTDYKVHIGEKTYWANCAWDMLGVPAMLKQAAVIETVFTDTQEQVEITVQAGEIHPKVGVVHFLIPFQHWYDDLILT